ncbi:unnamed protein product [Pleuronectes platessa]|uniref:Uncharacterized protein n=1 Tax=Pleuronectes platessa TaxID=8262 RepID=A0A9N7UJ75_PLEPL|nr:unnamed protein product [Pleuronectes platessa]
MTERETLAFVQTFSAWPPSMKSADSDGSTQRGGSLQNHLERGGAVSSVLRSMSDPPPPYHHLNSGYLVISLQTVQSEDRHETPQIRAPFLITIIREVSEGLSS